jgi:hypothetical protein
MVKVYEWRNGVAKECEYVCCRTFQRHKSGRCPYHRGGKTIAGEDAKTVARRPVHKCLLKTQKVLESSEFLAPPKSAQSSESLAQHTPVPTPVIQHPRVRKLSKPPPAEDEDWLYIQHSSCVESVQTANRELRTATE